MYLDKFSPSNALLGSFSRQDIKMKEKEEKKRRKKGEIGEKNYIGIYREEK